MEPVTAQPSTHNVKAFDDDLEQPRATVAELGVWAEAAHGSLYRSSMAAMIGDSQGGASAAHFPFAAQSLAKVAGRAAEIARLVHFAATGQRPPIGACTESRPHALS